MATIRLYVRENKYPVEFVARENLAEAVKIACEKVIEMHWQNSQTVHFVDWVGTVLGQTKQSPSGEYTVKLTEIGQAAAEGRPTWRYHSQSPVRPANWRHLVDVRYPAAEAEIDQIISAMYNHRAEFSSYAEAKAAFFAGRDYWSAVAEKAEEIAEREIKFPAWNILFVDSCGQQAVGLEVDSRIYIPNVGEFETTGEALDALEKCE